MPTPRVRITATQGLFQDDVANNSDAVGGLLIEKTNATSSISGTDATGTVTASGFAGIITTGTMTNTAGNNFVITVTNTKVLSSSVVMLTIQDYGGAGSWCLSADDVADGSFKITVHNAHASAAFNAAFKIGYLVL